MAIIARHNGTIDSMNIEKRALLMLVRDFSDKLSVRLRRVVKSSQIEQWDDPVNISLLLSRLETLAAKPNKDENDLVTIAAICCVLSNFTEE